jgi:helicase required for RNAi-mediated heterochromatin assembly 1
MVALSPVSDNFRSICKVAIVAARPIEGLNQNPPRIDIFWGDYNDATFDPVERKFESSDLNLAELYAAYVMLEARQGYYEASRHMLVALQKLRTEQ